MQIEDFYKLIFQNEFAGGHLIADENNSLYHLTNEFNRIKNQKSLERIFEDIGNGLVRLYLSSLSLSEINISTINRFFVTTANSHQGSIENFEGKMKIFLECCKNKTLPFDYKKAEKFINNRKNEGYIHISHSKDYRENYRPAYRVVKNEFEKYFEIFLKIDILTKIKNNITIAIDGPSSAGKSTLAALIEKVNDCNIFHMDHFFLTPDLRTKERLTETGGNIDYDRFYEEVIKGINSQKEFSYNIYDCSELIFIDKVRVQPKRINIIEGVYSMHPKFINIYDLKIFLEIDTECQSNRILKRNGKELHKRFINEWIPMENRYFTQMQIKEKSDLIYKT
jgi:uridine kinase